jgi:hypothetical protein
VSCLNFTIFNFTHYFKFLVNFLVNLILFIYKIFHGEMSHTYIKVGKTEKCCLANYYKRPQNIPQARTKTLLAPRCPQVPLPWHSAPHPTPINCQRHTALPAGGVDTAFLPYHFASLAHSSMHSGWILYICFRNLCKSHCVMFFSWLLSLNIMLVRSVYGYVAGVCSFSLPDCKVW